MRTQRSFVSTASTRLHTGIAAGWFTPGPYVPAEGLSLVVQDEGPAGQEGVVHLCECLRNGEALLTGCPAGIESATPGV
jgi:hypothetical protein